MNCVIERRRAEEFVDTPNRAMPFGFQLNVEPKKRITGERMAIFCESGSAIKWVFHTKKVKNANDLLIILNSIRDDEAQQQAPREIQIPVQRVPIPFGAIPQQYPLTHMPQQQMPVPPQIPPFVIRQIIAHQQEQQQQQQQAQHQFQQQQQQQAQQQFPQPRPIPMMIRQIIPPQMPQMTQMQQLPVPDTIMRAPRPEGEIRIHLQRIPIRELPIQMLQGRPNVAKESDESDSSSQEPGFPFREAFGLTAEDLRKIQMMAEERIQQELRTLAAEEAMNNESDGEDDDNDNESDEESQEQMGTQQPMMQQQSMEQQHQQQQQEQSQQQQSEEQDKSVDPAILPIGRANFARSVKIDLPVAMVQPEQQAEPERPHCE